MEYTGYLITWAKTHTFYYNIMNMDLKSKVNIFRSISHLQITSCHIKKHIFNFFNTGNLVSNYTKF